MLLLAQDPAAIQQLIKESVDAGPHWYPLAIASISMTDFLTHCLYSSTLTLYLLRHSAVSQAEAEEDDSDNAPLTRQIYHPDAFAPVFHALHAVLLTAFHAHWRHLCTSPDVAEDARPTVMLFERVFGKWKREVVRWLERGVLGGWVDSRGFVLFQAPAWDRKTRLAIPPPPLPGFLVLKCGQAQVATRRSCSSSCDRARPGLLCLSLGTIWQLGLSSLSHFLVRHLGTALAGRFATTRMLPLDLRPPCPSSPSLP